MCMNTTKTNGAAETHTSECPFPGQPECWGLSWHAAPTGTLTPAFWVSNLACSLENCTPKCAHRSHGCSSAPGGQACRVSKQCRQPVTHRSPLPLPGPLSLSQTPLPRHLFGLFAVSHLPPAFSEFDLKVLSSMFHILYMHLHVFRCVCLLEFALGFLYTLHAAGFLFALWKSHEF